mmetsp:Transcript_59821/g.157757  ORF Transcript_59821/g.157757 Transcript_59821/m.157757 type:complete len:314 (-) Transcript_59821:667-1608(-)
MARVGRQRLLLGLLDHGALLLRRHRERDDRASLLRALPRRPKVDRPNPVAHPLHALRREQVLGLVLLGRVAARRVGAPTRLLQVLDARERGGRLRLDLRVEVEVKAQARGLVLALGLEVGRPAHAAIGEHERAERRVPLVGVAHAREVFEHPVLEHKPPLAPRLGRAAALVHPAAERVLLDEDPLLVLPLAHARLLSLHHRLRALVAPLRLLVAQKLEKLSLRLDLLVAHVLLDPAALALALLLALVKVGPSLVRGGDALVEHLLGRGVVLLVAQLRPAEARPLARDAGQREDLARHHREFSRVVKIDRHKLE